jgi:hypothetical protein
MHERCETFLAGEQISEIDGKSELCSDCGQALRLEQLVEEIWLHARSYSIFDPVTEELRGKFEAPLPVWAQSPSF